MQKANCVLLADSHHGLTDGVRQLLTTAFRAVVMVADEVSLFESAARLHSDVAVLDLALPRGNALEFVRRFRNHFPATKMIVMSVHSETSVGRSVLEAGADGFIVKSSIATDLLAAADAVLLGNRYISPSVAN
jgi:DNA-binding NarL/FixJ family response regulator